MTAEAAAEASVTELDRLRAENARLREASTSLESRLARLEQVALGGTVAQGSQPSESDRQLAKLELAMAKQKQALEAAEHWLLSGPKQWKCGLAKEPMLQFIVGAADPDEAWKKYKLFCNINHTDQVFNCVPYTPPAPADAAMPAVGSPEMAATLR